MLPVIVPNQQKSASPKVELARPKQLIAVNLLAFLEEQHAAGAHRQRSTVGTRLSPA